MTTPTTYPCTCGEDHSFDEVSVSEQLARVVDLPNNVNKYWRVVFVTPPCGGVFPLTHSGRWTNGWRDRGQWKQAANQRAAHDGYTRKTRGEYHHANGHGEKISGPVWTQLPALETLGRSEQRRAHQSAIAAQSFLVVLNEAGLWRGGVSTPVANGSKPPKAGVDPLVDLGRRTDTLVTTLATSEFTAEMAAERAKLIVELGNYRERLEQVESTLEIADALMAR